jgi:predicted RNA-binding protein with RPS1 domain
MLDLNKGSVRLFDIEDSHISESFVKSLEEIIPEVDENAAKTVSIDDKNPIK